MKSTPEDEPRKTVLDRLIGSLKWGTVGTVAGGAAGVGLGVIARKGHFGPAFKKYAKRKFPLFPTPAVTHAIAGAGVGSKVGALAGLIAGRKPKDTKELSSLLDGLIQFSFFSDTKKLVKHLRGSGVEITKGSLRENLPTGYFPDKMISDPRFDEARSVAPTKRFISVGRHDSSAGMSPTETLWHEAGHAYRRSSQVNPNLEKYHNIHQIAVERGANRQAMKLADQLQVSPENRTRIHKGLKKSFKTYKSGIFEQLHYSWEGGKRLSADPILSAKLRNAGKEGKSIFGVASHLQDSLRAKKITVKVHPWLRGYKFSHLLDDLIQFKTLYVPGDKDEPPETIPKLEGVVDYTVQRHAAKRAGLHRDIRIGTPRHGLLSWATRKDLPGEGGRIAVHPQPVHSHDYLGWEGNIPSGYGAGDVSTEHLGKALVTKSTPTEVHATLADQKEHHRLALVKTPKGWLMTRGKHPQPPPEASKPSYKSIEPGKAHETFESLPPGSIVQPKVDGALVYVTTKGNRPEVFSHRKGKQSGKHIVHTERFFHGRPTTQVPQEHQRTLIGELYGTRKGKAIEPQELGGILNTHLGESITKQKKKGVDLKIMPFDYADGKGESYPERLAKVKATVQHLPAGKFHTPQEATSQEDVKQLFENIRKGRHPLTKEGVIIHPPHGKMIKIKNTSEANVSITGTFPGTGQFEGSHGGITYEGGQVGTGFTKETRRQLHKYVGRTARIRHQGRYPSGAYRAPSFIAIEENK